jgi:hypothetical protein
MVVAIALAPEQAFLLESLEDPSDRARVQMHDGRYVSR